ncbi:phage late control D family protein [Nostoc sp.]|uniref:phage late control D family protein n=1 Tax=Nostoc sp. TaxID=1180 RepID=UPI002FF72D4A
MLDFVPTYKNRDFYVPAYEIKINRQDLPSFVARDVMEVRYTDDVEKIDTFEITVNNWDAKNLDFKYTGSKKGQDAGEDAARSTLFDPGQEIEIWMGYFKPTPDNPTPQRMMLAGIITSLTPNFPASGSPTLKVSGQNIMRDFMRKQETHDYIKQGDYKNRDSDIAEKIGKANKLKYNNRPVPIVINCGARNQEPPNEHVSQKNQYDILFLMQLARRNSYDLVFITKDEDSRLRNSTGCPGKLPDPPFLYFGPSTNLARVSYLLEWGKSLIDFQPTLKTTKQVAEVTVQGWNALTKKPIKVTVKRSELDTRPQKDPQRMKKLEEGFKERRDVVVDKPFRDEKEAKQYARSLLTENSKNMVTGRGSTVGLPDLRAGSFIKIQGLGLTFDGRYFVKSTTHTINTSGYITTFDARLEEENK